jgi:sulfatase maturation enzyme AslB (radical SAM superfamily)
MDWPTLRAAVDFALEYGSGEVELSFLGGEPLMEWPKLRRAVKYAERRPGTTERAHYILTTNGLLLTDKIAGFLEKHDFETRLSFDGIPKAQDYRQKGTFSNLDRLLDSLREKHTNLFRDGLRIYITLIPAAIPYLADSIAYLIDKGIPDIVIAPCLTAHADWAPEGITRLEHEFSRVRNLSLKHFNECAEVPVAFLRRTKRQQGDKPKTRDLCGVASRRALMIDTDGQAYGCVLFTDSYQNFPSEVLATCMNTLRLGDFRAPDFWQRYAAFPNATRKTGLFHQKDRNYSSYGKCGDCPYLSECAVCPVSIMYNQDNHDRRRVPDFICAFNLVTLKYRRRFPLMPDPIASLQRLLGSGDRPR